MLLQEAEDVDATPDVFTMVRQMADEAADQFGHILDIPSWRGRDADVIEAACWDAERAGCPSGSIEAGRAAARRLRTNELAAAMRSGHAGRVEEACRRAEGSGVASPWVADGVCRATERSKNASLKLT